MCSSTAYHRARKPDLSTDGRDEGMAKTWRANLCLLARPTITRSAHSSDTSKYKGWTETSMQTATEEARCAVRYPSTRWQQTGIPHVLCGDERLSRRQRTTDTNRPTTPSTDGDRGALCTFTPTSGKNQLSAYLSLYSWVSDTSINM
jgi:hypothetical protein